MTNGDGLLLVGRTLYVVQNRDNQIAVVHLKKGLQRGEVKRHLTDPDLDVPTSIILRNQFLFAVNARLHHARDAEHEVPGREGPPLVDDGPRGYSVSRKAEALAPPGEESTGTLATQQAEPRTVPPGRGCTRSVVSP